MNEAWKVRFYDAIGPLTWGFELGDDGWLLTLALDVADSLLRELPQAHGRDEDGLVALLTVLDEPELAEQVATIYRLASLSNYDGGIHEKGADRLNDTMSDVAVGLETLAKRWSRKRKPARSKDAKVPSASQRPPSGAHTKTTGKKEKDAQRKS